MNHTATTPKSTDTPSILIVEDEPDLAELYDRWLGQEYDVRIAHTGTRALELIDETVGIVLLDRRLPEMSGDEVLATIRERGLGCQVIIVSAVEPAADILELGFDDYLTKPTNISEINRVVNRARTRILYAQKYKEFISLATKLATIEVALDMETLQCDPTYADLQAQFTEMVAELGSLPIGDEEYSELYQTKLQAVFENTLSEGLRQFA